MAGDRLQPRAPGAVQCGTAGVRIRALGFPLAVDATTSQLSGEGRIARVAFRRFLRE
jgi:hypothetical protein